MFDVSIIIPVYNAKYTLKKTLESINKQKYKKRVPKIELILSVDDNKNYDKYRSEIDNKIIKTKIVYTKKIGSGPGNTRNIGFKNSTGRYVCFLDADDGYSDNYIYEMLRQVKKEKLLIAVTKIFNKEKLIMEYKGKNKYMNLKELIKYPFSFHPFMHRSKFRMYENLPSQDIYNLTEHLSEKKIKIIKKAYYKLNYGRLWAGISFRNSFEGAQYVDVSTGELKEQTLQLITPLFGIDFKDFVFSYNYSHQFGDINFGSGGFHQITIGFNFLRGSIDCDCF